MDNDNVLPYLVRPIKEAMSVGVDEFVQALSNKVINGVMGPITIPDDYRAEAGVLVSAKQMGDGGAILYTVRLDDVINALGPEVIKDCAARSKISTQFTRNDKAKETDSNNIFLISLTLGGGATFMGGPLLGLAVFFSTAVITSMGAQVADYNQYDEAVTTRSKTISTELGVILGDIVSEYRPIAAKKFMSIVTSAIEKGLSQSTDMKLISVELDEGSSVLSITTKSTVPRYLSKADLASLSSHIKSVASRFASSALSVSTMREKFYRDLRSSAVNQCGFMGAKQGSNPHDRNFFDITLTLNFDGQGQRAQVPQAKSAIQSDIIKAINQTHSRFPLATRVFRDLMFGYYVGNSGESVFTYMSKLFSSSANAQLPIASSEDIEAISGALAEALLTIERALSSTNVSQALTEAVKAVVENVPSIEKAYLTGEDQSILACDYVKVKFATVRNRFR